MKWIEVCGVAIGVVGVVVVVVVGRGWAALTLPAKQYRVPNGEFNTGWWVCMCVCALHR